MVIILEDIVIVKINCDIFLNQGSGGRYREEGWCGEVLIGLVIDQVLGFGWKVDVRVF